MKPQNIQAQIKSIVEDATRKVIAALAKVPPTQWPTFVKNKAPRAERARADEEPRSARKGKKGARKERGRKKDKADKPVVAPIKKRNPEKLHALRVRLLDIVRAAPNGYGIAVGEIARKLNKVPADVRVPLDALRNAGLIVLEGDRRNARWFITEKGKAATPDSIGALFGASKKKAPPPVEPAKEATTERTEAATANPEPDAQA